MDLSDIDSILVKRNVVRVGILSKYKPKQLSVRGRGEFIVGGKTTEFSEALLLNGGLSRKLRINRHGQIVRTDHVLVQSSEPLVLELPGVKSHKSFPRAGRTYPGSLEITVGADGTLRITSLVPLETYVAAVARAETGRTVELDADCRSELMRAMRAVVRSYLLAFEDRHPEGEHEMCDLTHCMVFAGVQDGPLKAPEVALVLTDATDAFVPAYFSSTCGGVLGSPDVMWSAGKVAPDSFNAKPRERVNSVYRIGADRLTDREEDLCKPSPHYRWDHSLSKGRLFALLRESGGRIDQHQDRSGMPGSLGQPRLRLRDGRVSAFVGGVAGNGVPVAAFLSRAGRKLGWNVFKSNLFELEERGESYLVRGRGLGHGVGLCQWGARGLAGKGTSATEILRFYYPGARLARVRYQ